MASQSGSAGCVRSVPTTTRAKPFSAPNSGCRPRTAYAGDRSAITGDTAATPGVDSSRVRNGQLQADDWTRISKAMGHLADAPIWIDDNPNLTIMEIRAKARRLKSQVGDLGMIVIDYLQLMTGRSSAENRQVEVSELSRGLKILARELETPVVALSQLSRGLEMRSDKRPMLADLRESGSIEQDSDVVMFIYREEIYDPKPENAGQAEIIVSKHRSGPTGVVSLAFLPQYTLFANMARGFD